MTLFKAPGTGISLSKDITKLGLELNFLFDLVDLVASL
jgi:hypothetical protein